MSSRSEAVVRSRGRRSRFGIALLATVAATLGLGVPHASAAPLPQTITFTQPTSPAPVGTSASLVATDASGSGQPVTFSVGHATAPGDACTVSRSTAGTWMVSFTFPGTCVIDANQAAGGGYAAAPTVSEPVTVEPFLSTVSVSPVTSVYGQTQNAVATVKEADGSPASGTVQFSENGTAVGAPVAVGTTGTVISPELTKGGTLAPGSYSISAVFTPSSPNYTTALSVATTLTVGQATSATQAAVGPTSLNATVTALAPGAGTPTGTIIFAVDGTTVGTATLSSGTATFPDTLAVGTSHDVTASYSGDSDFTASTGVASRSDPTITASVSSIATLTTKGWYDAPVTVSFSCAASTAPLVGACPAPITLSANAAGQSASGTISGTDGGTATATVSGINIDQTPPVAMVSGVKAGGFYATAPRLTCLATDDLSGFQACKLTRTTRKSATGLDNSTVTYTAVATDHAGNVGQTTGAYHVLGIYLKAATYRSGAFLVRAGRSYTLTVRSAKSRPTFVKTSSTPVTAATKLKAAAHGSWTLKLQLPPKLFAHRKSGQLRIRIAGKLHSVPIQRA